MLIARPAFRENASVAAESTRGEDQDHPAPGTAPCGAFPAFGRRFPGCALTPAARLGSFRVRFRGIQGGNLIQRSFTLATLAVMFLLAGLAGCNDTKQPASSPVPTALISFRASGQMYKYNCWEVWQDTDFDGTPDQ